MARKLPTKDENTAGTPRWDDRFIAILERDYISLDSVIAAIVKNEPLVRMCAVKIRSYVDKDISDRLYKARKTRGAEHKKRLETAIAGINEAIGLYRDLGRETETLYLSTLAVELAAQLGRCKEAYGTKRHGRDRSHLGLYDCQLFLESALRRKITYTTLAHLVNAGFEAHGKPTKEPITEEQLRKTLEHFKTRNPAAVALASRNYPPGMIAETK
jgi:hypothetical protein